MSSNDFDDLADSIAQIVDNETAEAEEYVKSNRRDRDYDASASQRNTNRPMRNQDDFEDDDDDDYDYPRRRDPKSSKATKIVLFIALGLVAVGILVVAFLIAKILYHNAIEQSQNNYAYYNNIGYEAYKKSDYPTAIVNFNKALYEYKEGAKDIDMRMYLRDCYIATKQPEKAHALLLEVLGIDPYYLNAFTMLVYEYDQAEDYEAIRELYDSYKDCDRENILSLFDKYFCKEPYATAESGRYFMDFTVDIVAEKDAKIYYVYGNKDPKESGTIYDGTFSISMGTTKISFYAVNKYGFQSETHSVEYTVSYEAPEPAVISPKSGRIEATETQFVTINNVPIGAKAYYTLDGSDPTDKSTMYTGPFELREGNTTIKVIVYGSNGLTSDITTATITLKLLEKYSDNECRDLVYEALVKMGYCDKDSHENENGSKYVIEYYSKKSIDTNTIYMYKLKVGSYKFDGIWIGCNANTGDVYSIVEIDKNKYYATALDGDIFVEPIEEPETETGENETADEDETDPTEEPIEDESNPENESSEAETQPETVEADTSSAA